MTSASDQDTESFKTYCDMSRNDGGWTLLVTSKASDSQWNENTIKDRGGDNPSLQTDFSILSRADDITGIVDGDFEYRLEAGEPGQFGGIWRAPKEYRYGFY